MTQFWRSRHKFLSRCWRHGAPSLVSASLFAIVALAYLPRLRVFPSAEKRDPPSPLLAGLRRLQAEDCAAAGATLDAAAAAADGGAEMLCDEQLSAGAQSLRALERNMPRATELRVDNEVRCRSLRIFFRIAPKSASWSGAGRILGWRKEDVVLAALQGLRDALPPLALVGISSVNITVIIDGLNNDADLLVTWRDLVLRSLFSGGLHHTFRLAIRFFSIARGAFSGNRGTNLVQFGIARQDICFSMHEHDRDSVSRHLGEGAKEAAAAVAAARLFNPSNLPGGWWTIASGGDRDSRTHQEGHECESAKPGHSHPDDSLFYFVEDDYIHLPSALAELAQTLLLPWLDGSAPPDFLTLMDPPERLTRGREEADYGSVTVLGGSMRQWRTVQSSTMSFAGTCAKLRAVLPTLEREAPFDHSMWLGLRRRGFSLVGPVPALALHAVAAPDHSWYALGELGWCGLVWCLRDKFVRNVNASI